MYQGHATVQREGALSLGADIRLLRLPDLPPNAKEVRVAISSAEILRVIQWRRVRQSIDLRSLEEHVFAIEKLSQELNRLSSRMKGPRAQLVMIEKISSPHFTSSQRDRVTLNKKSQKVRQD